MGTVIGEVLAEIATGFLSWYFNRKDLIDAERAKRAERAAKLERDVLQWRVDIDNDPDARERLARLRSKGGTIRLRPPSDHGG